MIGSPPWLPQGYTLDECDTDILVLRRPDGSSVANFSPSGVTRDNLRKAAEDDQRQRTRLALEAHTLSLADTVPRVHHSSPA